MSLLGTSSPSETASTLAGVRLEMKSGVTKIQRHVTRRGDGLLGFRVPDDITFGAHTLAQEGLQ